VISGVTVVTTLVCSFICTRGCGCIERPAFPAPSILREAKRFLQTSDASRRENAASYPLGCLKLNQTNDRFVDVTIGVLDPGPRRTRTLKLPITIYGIKNCDTMKKARAWLDSHDVAYGFHDYKTEGIAREKLKRWSDELGWETLLNRAGTTFRKLPDGDKEGLNERKALALMLAQPSMIKRPVLDLGGKLLVGFKPEIYAREVAPSGRSRRG